VTVSSPITDDVPDAGSGFFGRRLRSGVDALRHATRAGSTQRTALFALTIRVASAALLYFSQVLLARWMGPFEYGVFVFVWVWVLILGGLGPIGMSTSAIRFIPHYRQRRRLPLLRGFLVASRLVAVSVSLVFMLAGLAGLYAFGDRLESYYLIPALIILFALPAYTLVDVQDGIARGFGWIGIALIPPYIVRHGLILAGVFAAFMLGFEVDAVTAAIAAVAACWIAALAQSVVLRRRISQIVPAGPRRARLWPWIAAALPVLLVLSFDLLLQYTDVLMLAHFHGPEQVGMYYAALRTIGLVSFIHFAVAAASAPHFSRHRAAGDEDALRKAVRDAVTWTFWPSVLVAGGLLALGKPLLWLFGPEFTDAYPAMFLLAAGLLIRASMGPAEYVLNMLGEQKACAFALCFGALLNVGLNFALVPAHGMLGAAIGTAIAMAFSSIVMFVLARRNLGLTLFIGARLFERRAAG
jgi:O-antigen/teichoic acid export membrane protein